MWRRRGASPKQALYSYMEYHAVRHVVHHVVRHTALHTAHHMGPQQAVWAVAREYTLVHGAVARYARLTGADAAAVGARLDALARATVGGGEAGAAGAGVLTAAVKAGGGDQRAQPAGSLPSAAAAAGAGVGAAVPRLSRVEYEAKLEPFAGVDDRYSTVIRQLGFVILFAPAFPLGASICLASNLLRMRTDGFMLLKSTQEGLPLPSATPTRTARTHTHRTLRST